MDNELLLIDRIGVIQDTLKQVGIDNCYLSFSGGKDSTILHHLLDMAIPGNHIPRVFCDTGIEYQYIRQFVFDLGKRDNRFEIIRPGRNITQMLEAVGYPFKSKQHSHDVAIYQNSGGDGLLINILVNTPNINHSLSVLIF